MGPWKRKVGRENPVTIDLRNSRVRLISLIRFLAGTLIVVLAILLLALLLLARLLGR
jgi:uncharacterized protein HemY